MDRSGLCFHVHPQLVLWGQRTGPALLTEAGCTGAVSCPGTRGVCPGSHPVPCLAPAPPAPRPHLAELTAHCCAQMASLCVRLSSQRLPRRERPSRSLGPEHITGNTCSGDTPPHCRPEGRGVLLAHIVSSATVQAWWEGTTGHPLGTEQTRRIVLNMESHTPFLSTNKHVTGGDGQSWGWSRWRGSCRDTDGRG